MLAPTFVTSVTPSTPSQPILRKFKPTYMLPTRLTTSRRNKHANVLLRQSFLLQLKSRTSLSLLAGPVECYQFPTKSDSRPSHDRNGSISGFKRSPSPVSSQFTLALVSTRNLSSKAAGIVTPRS